ncbi:bifunctional hydroxymethylpyrimidine kinase/phosphomethylpyrimidine kinase [Treponema porcinum]|uniref:bifunctional hydroxymethylpyrimidine kinase/phosphomethylpyrimidine kinase n=1 Tax=Treponema porcinum TaxID=261392 RepID=UPI0025950478|nr:bifunctional hydroxymethylpyrimidine kinase/phosphomethylpyrimidine kinase [Treponema porcinum]MDY4467212.1 bifunctional hydroxymethylpyrimidine kinase/phosphomethylpyrimidine kinase [Treponema porcinum]
MYTALTIAGSDSSGGAGIQADIKTMTAHGVYAMSAITALTAQNTTGVFAVSEVTPDFLHEQIRACVTDIVPCAVKTGMIPSAKSVEVIASCIREFDLMHVVVDPVMVATSGSRLIDENACEEMKKSLFPCAELITPNIPEAELLCGITIRTAEDMEMAARSLMEKYGCAVLCKGGHNVQTADDFLASSDGCIWLKGKRIDNPNTHGTGCTLSSAIASNLAKGMSLAESTSHAKEYISGALESMLDLGHGSGPLNHAWCFEGF